MNGAVHTLKIETVLNDYRASEAAPFYENLLTPLNAPAAVHRRKSFAKTFLARLAREKSK